MRIYASLALLFLVAGCGSGKDSDSTTGTASTLLGVAEQILGCNFRPSEQDLPKTQHAEVVEVSITFQAGHGLEDDMGIPFEEYPVSLEFARSSSQSEPELRESLCRVLAMLCARLIATRGHADTMVVRDLQELVESAARE